ncbi:MAG: apolipoprotein N-acyltransferase [Planctomycetota bacterium]
MRRLFLGWAVRRPFVLGLFGGLCFSALMLLSFAPVDAWPLAFVAAMPLVGLGELLAARRRGGVRRAALGAFIGAMPWWAFAMVWTARMTQLGYPPAVVYLSIYAPLFVAVYALVRRRFPWLPVVVLAPLLWTGFEVIRGEWVFEGYPWYLIGHPLIEAPGWWFAWPAAFVGAYGVSVLVMVPGAAVLDWIGSHARWAIGGGTLSVVWLALGVAGVGRPAESGSVRIGLVQTNVPQDIRTGWDPVERWGVWEMARDLTLEVAAPGDGGRGPDMIVWPETMFPGVGFQDDAAAAEEAAGLAWVLGPDRVIPAWEARERLLALQRSLGVPMVIGATAFQDFAVIQDERGLRYDWSVRTNSAFLVAGGAVEDNPYSKLQLVPFGEVMPYVSAWPWLETQLLAVGASGMAFDLSEGNGPVTLPVPVGGEPLRGDVVRVATPICFESTVSGVVREIVYRSPGGRADAIVVLTNDGWFGDWDPGRLHHLQASRWRCVELGVGMARAANTGVSAFVDATGRVIASGIAGEPGATRVAGTLVADLPTYRGMTAFGAAVGMWPARVLGWATVVVAVLAFVLRRGRA